MAKRQPKLAFSFKNPAVWLVMLAAAALGVFLIYRSFAYSYGTHFTGDSKNYWVKGCKDGGYLRFYGYDNRYTTRLKVYFYNVNNTYTFASVKPKTKYYKTRTIPSGAKGVIAGPEYWSTYKSRWVAGAKGDKLLSTISRC